MINLKITTKNAKLGTRRFRMKWFGMRPSDPSHRRPRSKGGLHTRAKEEKREENDVGKARSLPQERST